MPPLAAGPWAATSVSARVAVDCGQMDTLQFSLFFAALLVGYVLVHLRLARFEEHMQKVGVIRSIDDRLRVLVEAIEKLDLSRLERRLEQIHEDLEDLREATRNVQDAVVQIPAPPPMASAPIEIVHAPAPAKTPAARVQALVEARLLQLGYGRIQLLSALDGVSAHGDIDMQVECERNGMPAKGTIVVRNFGVRDVAMQTVAPMFP